MFNLEVEIHNWLRELRKNGGFEDGDIIEMEEHMRDSIERSMDQGLGAEQAFDKARMLFGALDEASDEMIKSRNTKMVIPRSKQLQLAHSDSTSSLIQFSIMFRNYFKVAIRNQKRNKLFSFINIFGLAMGIAICMIISFWVQRETGYDDFHSKSDKIFRVERELFRENLYSRWPITSGGYRDALLNDFPEIEHATRLWRRQFVIRDSNNNSHSQEMFAVDNSVFDIFDFTLERGDPATALSEPKSVVLTRERAIQFFGTDDVVGNSLDFELNGQWAAFKITGIIKEVPLDSHLHFSMLMSISTYPDSRFNALRSNYLYTYVLLRENTDKAELENKFKRFVATRLAPVYDDLTRSGSDIHDVLKMELFPITSIHLDPSPNWEIEAGGNTTSIFIFSSISILILLIASLNFINLSTARAGKRALEVGLRKTFGAHRTQLRFQFIHESMFSTLLATILAFGLISLFIPLYNSVFSDSLTFTVAFEKANLIGIITIALIVGFLSGIYPAFYLTRFRPANVVRGGDSSGKVRSTFRRNIVILQFIISAVLIIGMLTVYNQMKYIDNRELGFDKENVIMLSGRSSKIAAGFEGFKNELVQNSRIVSVSASGRTPVGTGFSNTNFWNNEIDARLNMHLLMVDYDFVNTYKMEVVAGRAFSRDFATDTAGIIMLNEAAVEKLGWSHEKAISETLDYSYGETKVVGVLKNFNFKSIRDEIEPLALILNSGLNAISIRIEQGEYGETIDFIEKQWQEAFDGEQFEYSLLDDSIDRLYERERSMQSLFIIFSSISVFIACLGLFGLAAFIAEVKIKEIGIRKVLGASTQKIVLLLSKDFIKWIAVANIIAWPIAWYSMDQWLQNFAYRTEMKWIVFLLALIITLVIAVSTFSVQAIKAAGTNPAKCLRSE